MTSITNKSYLLPTGTQDLLRPNAQEDALSPISLPWIKRYVKPGKTVMDVGCGHGGLTIQIAQYIGVNGKVIAVDNSPEQLDIVRKRAKELNVTNIQFIQSNVYDLNKLAYKVDAVHCRWLLAHLRRPMDAIQAMRSQLNSRGILLFEEPNGDIYDCHPYTPISFTFWIIAVKIQHLIAGTSREIANKMLEELPSNGFTIEYSTPLVANTSSFHKSRFRIGIENITQRLDYPIIRTLIGWWVEGLRRMEENNALSITQRSFCQIAAKAHS